MSATVLVGLGVRACDDAVSLEKMAATAGARVAWLQVGDPSLPAVLDDCVMQGHREVMLVAVNLDGSPPAQSWLRRVAAHWWRTREAPLTVRIAREVLDSTELADVASVLATVGDPIHGGEAPLHSPSWEHVPRYRHHLLVCRGPRCTAMGADNTVRAMAAAIDQQGLGDDEVLVAMTGCLYPCNHGPVLVIQPDDIWYGKVDAAAAEQIVEEHLVGGDPVAGRRLSRAPTA